MREIDVEAGRGDSIAEDDASNRRIKGSEPRQELVTAVPTCQAQLTDHRLRSHVFDGAPGFRHRPHKSDRVIRGQNARYSNPGPNITVHDQHVQERSATPMLCT